MGPEIISLLEPVVVLTTLLGVTFGVKLIVWGKGPIKRSRPVAELERRVHDLEERLAQSTELTAQQSETLLELEERLDFAERLLTQHRAEVDRVLPPRKERTPV